MAQRYRSVLMFGAPGVGKGTQGRLLGMIPGFFHLATGDMFRSLDRECELGKEFQLYSSRGELVPDHLTLNLWEQYVDGAIRHGAFDPKRDVLVLDGIPRSVNQARMLKDKIDVLRVLHLTSPDVDALVSRIMRRAEQEGRIDDADEKVIRRRIDIYHAETQPVLREYPKEVVCHINALGLPAEVLLKVLTCLVPIYAEEFENPLR